MQKAVELSLTIQVIMSKPKRLGYHCKISTKDSALKIMLILEETRL